MEVSKVCFNLTLGQTVELSLFFFFNRTKYIEYTDIIIRDLTCPKDKLKYYDFPQKFWKNWFITSKYLSVGEWQVTDFFNKFSLQILVTFFYPLQTPQKQVITSLSGYFTFL